MSRVLLVAFVLLAPIVAVAAEPPVANWRDGWIEVALPGSMLDEARVHRRVTSGLTATFILIGKQRGADSGAARFAIRFEPWDEVFILSLVHADGERSTTQLGSLEAIRQYFDSSPVRLLRSAADETEVDVEVRLVPFSSEEAAEARDWFLESIGSTPKGEANGGASSVDGIVDVLIATSIRVRPEAIWKWRVTVRKQDGMKK